MSCGSSEILSSALVVLSAEITSETQDPESTLVSSSENDEAKDGNDTELPIVESDSVKYDDEVVCNDDADSETLVSMKGTSEIEDPFEVSAISVPFPMAFWYVTFPCCVLTL